MSLPDVVVIPQATVTRRVYASRVVILGSRSCGKSSLCAALAAHPGAPFEFQADMSPTIGCDLVQVHLQKAGQDEAPYSQHLWDFAGDRRFRMVMNRASLRNVQVLMLCCAGDSPLSFAEVHELYTASTPHIDSVEQTIKLLVVLKADLAPAVSVADLRALSVRMDARLLFVSAKTGEGVDVLRRLLWFAATLHAAADRETVVHAVK